MRQIDVGIKEGRIILRDNFVIRNYDCKFPLVTSKLTVAKVLHINNFIKNLLHHRLLVCNFLFFFIEFLENPWVGSGCRAFKLCAWVPIKLFVFSLFPGIDLHTSLFHNFHRLIKFSFLHPKSLMNHFYGKIQKKLKSRC